MHPKSDGQFLPFISAVFLSLAVAWARVRRYLAAPAYVLSLMAVIFVPLWIGPYTGKGPPGTYREPEPIAEKSDKVQDRIIQPIRVATISYRLDPPVQKASLAELVNAPWPCAQIRQAVERFGQDAVKREAKRRGYTKKQIDEAMACVAEKRSDARCDGPARYEAMREAFEAGRPQPC